MRKSCSEKYLHKCQWLWPMWRCRQKVKMYFSSYITLVLDGMFVQPYLQLLFLSSPFEWCCEFTRIKVCFFCQWFCQSHPGFFNSFSWLTTPIFMVCKQDLTWLIHFTLTYAKSKKNNTWKSSNIRFTLYGILY